MKKCLSALILVTLTQLLIVSSVFSASPDMAVSADGSEAVPDVAVTAPDPEPAAQAVEEIVMVTEAQICQDVANREPVAPGDIFPVDTPLLYCFTRISSNVDTAVTHAWYKGDALVAEVPLKVGASSSWRTFSSKNIMTNDAGNWRVEILGKDRTLLKKIHFALN